MKIPNSDFNKKECDNNYILKWPFRLLVVGDSSRGKTNAIIFMILSCEFFDRPDIIYYYGRNIKQDKIQYLKSISDKMKEKIGYDFLVLQDDIEKIPYADSYDKSNCKKLVIFDDLMTVNKNISNKIIDHFIYGRLQNISSVYMSQCYTNTSQTIRLNSNYMILYQPNTKRTMKMILRENFINENAFDHLKGNEHKHDFIFIDKDNERYNKNFDEEI